MCTGVSFAPGGDGRIRHVGVAVFVAGRNRMRLDVLCCDVRCFAVPCFAVICIAFCFDLLCRDMLCCAVLRFVFMRDICVALHISALLRLALL